MIGLLLALLALALGAVLALALASDPGYVLVAFRGYTLELTLATGVLSLLLALVLLLALIWLLRLGNPLGLFRRETWRRLLRSRDAARDSAEGLQLLLLGQWQEAYRLLVRGADGSRSPALHYVAAALAAFRRGDRVGWHWCLEQAEKTAHAPVQGLNSLRALLETRAGHHEQARVILHTLQRLAPGKPFVLEQLRDLSLELGDWDTLALLLPELERHKVGTTAELQVLAERIHGHRLQQSAAGGLQSLQAYWQSLPKPLRHSESLVGVQARQLLRLGADAEALSLLHQQLKLAWSESLVSLLGHCHDKEPRQLLQQLEQWLPKHPGNPVLLLTLGRASLRNQLWGKAREYFEGALRSSGSAPLSAEINAELGRLLASLGESERSLACYRHAAELMEHKLPALPQPETQR